MEALADIAVTLQGILKFAEHVEERVAHVEGAEEVIAGLFHDFRAPPYQPL